MRFALKTFVVVMVAGFCLSARASLVDAIMAIVGDSVITYQQIQTIIIQQDERLKMQAKDRPEEYYKLVGKLEADILRDMVNQKMILHEFASAGFKIPENIIDDYVQDKVHDYFHDDRVEMMKKLQYEGLSYEDFKQQLHDEFIVMLMRQKFVPEPIISPLKVETYYKDHNAEFKEEDRIKMRLIVLNRQPDDTNGTVRRRMEEILSQVKDGAAFSDLAKSYSEGSQRKDGGETGWQDTSIVNKTLLEATKNLKPGEYSGVIESPEAYFLVLLEERKPARVQPLNEVRDVIEKTLITQERGRLLNRWIARLRRKTFVETF
jgi:peptidyl-prolyl cis-trans isomerase SurA